MNPTSSHSGVHDPHVVSHDWPADLEHRARNAKIETTEQLHQALMWVHIVCHERLPHPLSTVADCYIGRLLDDQAELYWREGDEACL